MKPVISLLIMFFSTFQMNAQTWFDQDDAWTYSYFAPFATSGYSEFTVVDTITVNGKESVILKNQITAYDQQFEQFVSDEREIVCYEENDKVYKLNFEMEFELLYDFSLEVGDSIVYYFDYNMGNDECKDSIVYYLDSLSITEFAGEELQTQNFSFYDVDYDYQGTKMIIETIGDVGSAFDVKAFHNCILDQESFNLCAFNNIQNELKFTLEDCFSLPVSTDDILTESNRVYPNPSTDYFYVSDSEFLESLSIYNPMGILIKKFSPANSYDISVYEKGSYIIQMKDKDGRITSTVLIKQ